MARLGRTWCVLACGLGTAWPSGAGSMAKGGPAWVELGMSRPDEADRASELCGDDVRWLALVRVALHEAFLADLVWLAARPSHGGPMVTWAGRRRTVWRQNLGGRRQIGEREKVRREKEKIKEKENKGRF